MTPKKRISLRVSNIRNLEFSGEQYMEKPELQLFTYNADGYSEDTMFEWPTGDLKIPDDRVSWLNVHGIHDIDLVNNICNALGVPRFAIQDVLDINQRTKMQLLDEQIFFSMKSMRPGQNKDFDVEQISFILGKNYLLSFQEKKGDHFEHIRVRIRNDNGLVRKKGADFLLFLLVEGIMENYYTTIDVFEDVVKDTITPIPTMDPDPEIIVVIEGLKRKLQRIKKNVMSLKDAFMVAEKGISPLIDKQQIKYFVDLKENSLYLLDNITSLEMRLDSAENLFFSIQGHRMNQVMTTLTIMAAIFIPLTFMAGIYGMNFENMPELGWKYSYFILLGIMALVTLVMLLYFRRRKWF